jgi:pimeloyl-ACP methyl ester carboxylesterase
VSNVLSLIEEDVDFMRGCSEELVYVERADGLALEGAIIRPTDTTRDGAAASTAVIMVHGNTSRFYDQLYVDLGREIAARGYAFITANTHGHDVASVIWGPDGSANPGGACWERFEEVPLDLDAWTGLAADLGYERVVLIGHSFGANKVVFYQAERQHPNVAGVISASGDIRWKAAPERLALAEQMEAEGNGDDVLPAVETPWYRMSARTFLGRARIAQHVLDSDAQDPYISLVRCPILAFYGTEEEWCGAQAELDTIRRNAASSPRVDTLLIEGADHVYWRREAEVAGIIAGWIDGIVEAAPIAAASE